MTQAYQHLAHINSNHVLKADGLQWIVMKTCSPHPDKPLMYTMGGREQLLKLLRRDRIDPDIVGLAEIAKLPSDEEQRMKRRCELQEVLKQPTEDTF
jgi:hypothetical protein